MEHWEVGQVANGALEREERVIGTLKREALERGQKMNRAFLRGG